MTAVLRYAYCYDMSDDTTFYVIVQYDFEQGESNILVQDAGTVAFVCFLQSLPVAQNPLKADKTVKTISQTIQKLLQPYSTYDIIHIGKAIRRAAATAWCSQHRTAYVG